MKAAIRGICLSILAIFLHASAGSAADIDLSKTINDIRVKGVQRADTNTVRYYIHAKKHEKYDSKEIAEDIKRLYGLGFFDDIRLDVKEEGAGLVLTYIFKEKPFVRDIIVKGGKEVDEKSINEKLKTKKGTFFRQDHIPWDQDRIRQLYRNKGFYFTEITTIVHKIGDNQVDVEYKIDESKKVVIGKVVFRGNKTFSNRILSSQIETKSADWTAIFSDAGAYKKDALKTDLLRVESYYHDNGYIKVKVADPEVEVDKEKRRIYIVFPITEGEQYRVGKVEAEGDDVYTSEQILEKVKLKTGDVFNRSQFRQDVLDITDLYSQKGYAFANVMPNLDIHDDTKTVDMKIKVNKGRKVYIGKITITGNDTTRDKVIRREFRLREGDLFDSEKLRRTRERINKLGFFDNVEIEQRSRKEEDLVDLEVKVVERSTGQLSFAVGYSSVENVILQGQIKWGNLLGYGQELAITTDYSSRRTDFDVSFTDPALFDRELSGTVEAYNRSYQYDAYSTKNVGGSTAVGRGLGEYLWGKVGYRYEENEVVILDRTTASAYLISQEGRGTAGSVFPSLTYDTRNDPFNPTAGTKLYGYSEASGFGGDQRFYRLTGEYTGYKAMWFDFVGMLHAKIGRADGYNDQPLPITQRFFMGGPRSLRGFTVRDVGPKDINGETIGGEAMLQFNTEMQYRFTKFFRGFLFYDRGNVYGRDDAGHNTTDKYFSLDDMRHSWGFGVHFYSPVGPITIAYGFKLDKRSGESPSEFHFTIGGAF